MSRADGEIIKVTFDQPLTGAGASDHEHFRITFRVPSYVPGGVLETTTRTPYATDYQAQDVPVTLASGTLSGLQLVDGVLQLSEA